MTTEAVPGIVPFLTKLSADIQNTLRDASNSMMSGDTNLALRLYNKVLEAEPQNTSALLNIGNIHDLLGNYSDALKYFGSLIEIDPYNAEAWYNRGMTKKKTGDVEEGLKDMQKGISLAMGEP